MKIDPLFLEVKLGINVEVFDEIDSTSLYLKRLITEGKAVPDLVVAHAQTNGRGRTGKSFYSPASTGLYATFAFKATLIHCDDITPRVALATARAIDSVFSCQSGVKWVNDVYLHGKKVSGILCQKVDDYLLIGIGINVEEPDFVPKDLLGRFGAVTEKCQPAKYNELVVSLYNALFRSFEESKDSILLEYRKRCVHLKKEVTILQNGQELIGICTDIDDDFSLILSIDGKTQRFTSGYMSLKI